MGEDGMVQRTDGWQWCRRTKERGRGVTGAAVVECLTCRRGEETKDGSALGAGG